MVKLLYCLACNSKENTIIPLGMCRPLAEEGMRNGKEEARKSNYRVRFRHGVYPDQEGSATREDIKKYDYFFDSAQEWVCMPTKGTFRVLFWKALF